MTQTYRKRMIIFLVLSALCLFGPISFYFARAFVLGDTTQKLTLGATFMVASILFIINLVMKSHLRSIFWVLLLGVYSVLHSYLSIIVVFALTTFAEELIFFPLFRYYKTKLTISKEIDKRIT